MAEEAFCLKSALAFCYMLSVLGLGPVTAYVTETETESVVTVRPMVLAHFPLQPREN